MQACTWVCMCICTHVPGCVCTHVCMHMQGVKNYKSLNIRKTPPKQNRRFSPGPGSWAHGIQVRAHMELASWVLVAGKPRVGRALVGPGRHGRWGGVESRCRLTWDWVGVRAHVHGRMWVEIVSGFAWNWSWITRRWRRTCRGVC